MQVSVSPEVKKFIDDEIAQGHYTSAAEVVERAIEALREQETADQRRLADLRALIAVAREEADRGEVVDYADPAQLIADIRSGRSRRR